MQSFRERVKRVIINIDYNISDKKLQYNFIRELVRISALPSSKFDKNDYFTCDEILPFNQSQMIEKGRQKVLCF